MDDFLAYTILGICLGSIYAIAATGLVVTYTTSGIFNFAHGAIGMLSAVVYWQLHEGWGVPAIIAVVLTVCVFAPFVGAILEVLIMRGLQGTSEITQLVIPIAVLLAVNGVATWVWFRGGQKAYLPERFFGDGSKVDIFGQAVFWHQILAVCLAIVIAAALYVLLYRTRLGVTMRATVDDRHLLMMNGGRPDRMSLASWAIGSGLAGLAGVLLAPNLGALQVLALTLLVFDTYPAAIVGRLKSVPLTYIGAISIGLAKSWWDGFALTATGPRWPSLANMRIALPAMLLFVALLLLPQERLRGAVVTRTRERFNVPTLPAAAVWGAVLVAVVAMLQALMVNSAVITLANGIALALLALPLVLLTGYAGQVNLAAYSFAGIAVIVAYQFDVGPQGQPTRESMSVLAIALAMVVCGIVGGLIALPALRLKGLYLGLATFAFAIVVDQLVLRQSDPIRPGLFGWDFELNLFTNSTFTVPRPNWFGIDFLDSQRAYLMLMTVLFAVIGIGLIALRRSPFGRAIVAMKDSPAACATLGLDVVRLKLTVFVIASALSGLGGLMWASQQRTVNNNGSFDVFLGLSLFLIAVVGGIGYVSGALLAGIFLSVLSVIMPNIFTMLGEELPGLNWLFVDVLGNFTKFVGPALVGIGLAKNPSGIAQQIMDGFRPLKKTPAPVAIWVGGLVALWALAWADVISNWTFALAVIASVFTIPRLIMRLRPEAYADELAVMDGRNWDMAGLDEPLDLTDREHLDTALGLAR
jgi:branched-chain amino acid transport system permease protein